MWNVLAEVYPAEMSGGSQWEPTPFGMNAQTERSRLPFFYTIHYYHFFSHERNFHYDQ